MSSIATQSSIVEPADCADMTEVRCGVDAVDRALIELLARRFAYMDAAARIKTNRDTVRDQARKLQVIANVREMACNAQIPADAITEIWDRLVEASIDFELTAWDRRNANQA